MLWRVVTLCKAKVCSIEVHRKILIFASVKEFFKKMTKDEAKSFEPSEEQSNLWLFAFSHELTHGEL